MDHCIDPFMMQKLISIELGESHYFFISDVVAIRIDEYRSMSQEQKDNICTATTKFGEEVPDYLVSRMPATPDRDYFYGRRKIFPNQPSKYQRCITRLTPEIEPLYKKVRHLCELIDVNGKAVIAFEPANGENSDLQTFISYVQFTK